MIHFECRSLSALTGADSTIPSRKTILQVSSSVYPVLYGADRQAELID